MADKYIIEGAAFDGDGTSSAEATSNGGVGAWNTITYFEGATPAYGSIAAGDTVYIRSKTAAGADITRTLAASMNLGSSVTTDQNPTKWVIDAGDVWPGVQGVIKYLSTTNRSCGVLAHNHITAKAANSLILDSTWTSNSSWTQGIVQDGSVLTNVFFDMGNRGGAGYGFRYALANCTLLNPRFRLGPLHASAGHISISTRCSPVMINPTIEVDQVAGTTAWLFEGGALNESASLRVFGGEIFGPGAVESLRLVNATNNTVAYSFEFIGTKIPNLMPLSDLAGTSFTKSGSRIAVINADGILGAHFMERWGEASSRNDGNFPVLNALLPSSVGTKWSWRIYPKLAGHVTPMLLSTSKVFTGESAVCALSLELLISNTFSSLCNKETIWVEVGYISNDTGAYTLVSTKSYSPDPLSESDANWSSLTYGPTTCVRRRLTLITPTAVKKDTAIIITLCGVVRSGGVGDILFMCPDVVLQ